MSAGRGAGAPLCSALPEKLQDRPCLLRPEAALLSSRSCQSCGGHLVSWAR